MPQSDWLRCRKKKLEEFRAANKIMCTRDPLMPKFSPDMNLCCLTKTHFTHSEKLIADGNRSQFNMGKLPAVLKHGDAEGQMIQEYGVEAIVYSAEIWNDPVAMQWIRNEDNSFNADCRPAEGEHGLDALWDELLSYEARASSQAQGKGTAWTSSSSWCGN